MSAWETGPKPYCMEFGGSKQPVMEALRRLSGDGLIEILPQVGSRVATPRDVSDFDVMFGGFEGTIAGVAHCAAPSRSSTSWS
jgi:DNA-binding GntR family transcriptional regulator